MPPIKKLQPEAAVQVEIFLVDTPTHAHTRRSLRVRALDLYDRLTRVGDGPCLALLNIERAERLIDLVLIRPRSVIVGVFHDVDGPIDVRRDHPWLIEARAARAAVVASEGFRGQGSGVDWGKQANKQTSRQADKQTQPPASGLQPLVSTSQISIFHTLGSPVAAVVVAPGLDAESQLVLDVEDHRQRVKVLGLDELAPLAAMLQADTQLDVPAMHAIAHQFAGQLWLDDQGLRFELGLAPYQLHMLNGVSRYQLLEGANILGRRAAPLHYEYRLTIPGDDSISADHAILVCAPDGRIMLRDTSTNGSFVRLADGSEERVHRSERAIDPGTILRFGETLLQIETLA